MKHSRLLFFILGIIVQFFFAGCTGNEAQEEVISDSLRQEAIELARDNLREESQWVKVHAAEYLLKLGYPQGVKEIFLEEEQKFGNKSPYRIGIWRVLAQAAEGPKDRQIWIDKILEAYQDPNGRDRVHAAETLAKLQVSPMEEYPEPTRRILDERNDALSAYTHWAISTTENVSRKEQQDFFLNLITQEETTEEASVRRTAAYALRHLGTLDGMEWQTLSSTALSEPEKSPARAYLLSAAFVTAPDDSVQSITYSRIKKNLLKIRSSSKEAARMEMVAALAEKGGPEDLPLLIDLMKAERQESLKNDESNGYVDSDLAATAAYAILRIDQRKKVALAVEDWLVIIIYLLAMLGIGFYYYRKNKTENDYFLGGGKMNSVTVGLSLFATIVSSVSYLAYPGEMIKHGPVIFIGMIAFPLIYYLVGWFIIPRIKNLNVTSAYEILEIKLGVSVRILATTFFLLLRFLWMATIVYITVYIVILTVIDVDESYALLVGAILLIITIIYSSIGGLKAIVVTDTIQAVVLLGGALAVIFAVSFYLNSFTSWIPDQWMSHWGEFKLTIDARDRSSIGAAVLMTLVWYVASAGSDQMSIQRFLATKDVRSARKTFGVSLLATAIAMTLLGLVGLALTAYFIENPQHLNFGGDVNVQADKLFPRFMVIGLPAGLSGLLIAGVLAAAMSSLSSGLNSCASVITEDIVKRFLPKRKKATNELKQVQKLSVFVGVVTLLLSSAIPYVSGNLYDLTVKVVNLLVSPLFVLFFMALFIPFATARGTFIGGVFSVIIAVAIAFFGFLNIDVFFITIASLFTGIIIGTLCSFIDHKVLGNQETASNRNKRMS